MKSETICKKRSCKYLRPLTNGSITLACHYCLDNLEPRLQDASECTYYEKRDKNASQYDNPGFIKWQQDKMTTGLPSYERRLREKDEKDYLRRLFRENMEQEY